MAITKKNKKEAASRCAASRACSHDYPPPTRRDKNHVLPPRTSREVLHALFLLQAKLPRELAVRVLDLAEFWIWADVPVYSYAHDRHSGRHMFISCGKLQERPYARMRRLVFGLELKSFVRRSMDDDLRADEMPGWRFEFEAVTGAHRRPAGERVEGYESVRPHLIRRTKEHGGGPIVLRREPRMYGVRIEEFDRRLDYIWTERSDPVRTGFCAHILYALV